MTHRGYANNAAIPVSSTAVVTGAPEVIPASLFRTHVYDGPSRPNLIFSIPTVAAQAYEVDLMFAEIRSSSFGVGRRVFDVLVEGKLALDNLDVFAAAGGNRALMRTFTVIGDGTLSIELQKVVQNPFISGIRVRPLLAPNTAPTISSIAGQQTPEDTAISGISFTVSDAENQPLTVSVSSSDSVLLPAAGLVLSGTGSDRLLSITPAANRFGTAQVTVSVSDGRATSTSSFAVNVSSVNDVPVAVADSVSAMLNTAVTVPALTNDTDIDGTLNPGSVVIVEQSANGTATANSNGTIQFIPKAGFLGSTSFRYSVSDNDGGQSQPATVTVLVRSNAAPVISAISDRELGIGSRSGPIAFQVTDSDGDPLTVTATTADASIVRSVTVTGTGSSRQLAITAGNIAGLTTVTISVSDGINTPVTRIVPVSVFTLIDAGTLRPISGAVADTAFQNGVGSRYSSNVPVRTTQGTLAASVPEQLYRTALWNAPGGKSLQFDIGAKAGQRFAVDLFFAEVWPGVSAASRRVFDVSLDGRTVLDDFDVFKEAGGANVGIARRFEIESDGIIDLDLLHGIQNPLISGIRVTPLKNPGN
jgi:hypothetical protein